MKVIIAGSRSFDDYETLKERCNYYLQGFGDIEIVSGGARGADTLAERYAKEHGYKFTPFSAEWDKYGKSAGFRRNIDMANYGDALIAFWNGKSRGTRHMIEQATLKGLRIRVIKYE